MYGSDVDPNPHGSALWETTWIQIRMETDADQHYN